MKNELLKNRENIGMVEMWGMEVAMRLISCGKFADSMIKSKTQHKG